MYIHIERERESERERWHTHTHKRERERERERERLLADEKRHGLHGFYRQSNHSTTDFTALHTTKYIHIYYIHTHYIHTFIYNTKNIYLHICMYVLHTYIYMLHTHTDDTDFMDNKITHLLQ